MPQFTAVSRERHATARWSRPRNMAYVRHDPTVPLVMAELSKAIPTVPVAFIAAGGAFQLVAVLSLVPGQNMCVTPDGRWLLGYMPAAIRAFPFRMLLPEGGAEPILCIDERCELLPGEASDGEAFFNADGSISAALEPVLRFHAELERNRAVTQLAVGALQQANLIVPWTITIRSGDGERAIEGLYKIDEAAMNDLPVDAFDKLRAVGALPIAYGQLFSMNQLSVFRTLADMQAKLAPQPAPAMPDTLDKLFDTGDNAYLHFD